MDGPNCFKDFVNGDKLIPTTVDQMEGTLDVPDCKYIVNEHEEQGMGQELQLVPSHYSTVSVGTL
jgi:hypothetical protein